MQGGSLPLALGDALARLAGDPAEFENFVSEVVIATREAGQIVSSDFETLVRESLPLLVTTTTARQQAVAVHLDALAEPCVAVEENGAVLHVNASAQLMFGAAAEGGIAGLGIDWPGFVRFLERVRAAPDQTAILVCEEGRDEVARMWLGRRMAIAGVICLSPVTPRWPARLSGLLAEEFGLSPRELSVLRGLMDGHSIDAIAEGDGRAPGTIRQSVKALLAKLGVRSQTQAVAMVSAMAAGLTPAGAPLEPAAETVTSLTVRDRLGRTVGLRRYGAPGGVPVLLCHGTLFGIGELQAERRLAVDLGLDILACERPGYGRTPPCKARTALLEAAVDDMMLTLDTLGIERVAVLAHDTGFAHAAALAARAPGRVAGIVAVSPVIPARTSAQASGMPPQQQVFAWAARHAPWLIEILTRIGVQRMRKLGPAGWPHAVFAGVERDMAVLSEPEALAAFRSAYAFNIAQSALGFRGDVAIANSDWSALLYKVAVPIHLIHGALNRTVPIEAVAALSRSSNAIVLETVADAGHTLVYSGPQSGLRAAFALAVRSGLA